jgi:hypothetical protein
METVSIVGYPSGNLIDIEITKFDNLLDMGLVFLDEEWTIETPNGQYGFNDVDEVDIKEYIEDKNSFKTKDEIEFTLIEKWKQFGMDVPKNYEDIVQFCYEDILETADKNNWHDGDVAIAFRRWIESKENTSPPCFG